MHEYKIAFKSFTLDTISAHSLECTSHFCVFLFFFLHSRSTIMAKGMFISVLIILVFPCSSLEGKCLVTKHSLSCQT